VKTRTLWVWCVLSASSFAMGPVVEAGANVTLAQSQTSGANTVTFNHLAGPVVRAGFEIGERFNHALVFEFSQSSGVGSMSGVSVPVGIQTFAGRYTFSVDFLKKEGFTPSLGVGVGVGQFTVTAANQVGTGLYLAFHAVAGARYTFGNGLGVRLDVAVSTYGGFIGLQPTAGVSYRF
jgi:hypothetical protein